MKQSFTERDKRLVDALGMEDTENRGPFNSYIQFSNFLKEEAKVQYPFIRMLEQVIIQFDLRGKLVYQ